MNADRLAVVVTVPTLLLFALIAFVWAFLAFIAWDTYQDWRNERRHGDG